MSNYISVWTLDFTTVGYCSLHNCFTIVTFHAVRNRVKSGYNFIKLVNVFGLSLPKKEPHYVPRAKGERQTCTKFHS